MRSGEDSSHWVGAYRSVKFPRRTTEGWITRLERTRVPTQTEGGVDRWRLELKIAARILGITPRRKALKARTCVEHARGLASRLKRSDVIGEGSSFQQKAVANH